jgi:hypothetical protein
VVRANGDVSLSGVCRKFLCGQLQSRTLLRGFPTNILHAFIVSHIMASCIYRPNSRLLGDWHESRRSSLVDLLSTITSDFSLYLSTCLTHFSATIFKIWLPQLCVITSMSVLKFATVRSVSCLQNNFNLTAMF